MTAPTKTAPAPSVGDAQTMSQKAWRDEAARMRAERDRYREIAKAQRKIKAVCAAKRDWLGAANAAALANEYQRESNRRDIAVREAVKRSRP